MLRNISKYGCILVILVATSVASFALPVYAQTNQSMDPTSAVDDVLCSMGLGCSGSSSNKTPTNSTSTINSTKSRSGNPLGEAVGTTTSSGGFLNFLFGGSSQSTSAVIYGATISRAYTTNQITLVRVRRSDSIPGQLIPDEQVYEIINNQKHLIPNLDIFFDYKFKAAEVQFISQEDLNQYPRVSLVQIAGDKTKTVYYVTNNGMIRKVLSQEVLESYGGRSSDVIVISKKEFNFYPVNKFVYLAQLFTGDIYLIDGNIKRYLTSMAVQRMEIKVDQLAPINETEFNAYQIGKPVVF